QSVHVLQQVPRQRTREPAGLLRREPVPLARGDGAGDSQRLPAPAIRFVTEKRLTVILSGSNRDLWSGGPVKFRVTDIFAAGGPTERTQGKTESSTLELRLQLPFDAGQIYGLDFTAPGHHPAWQLVRRADFIRQ